jgi:hypothetical protein
VPIVPQLLRTCWRTKIYHLRLDALRVAASNASALEGPSREETKTFLSSLHSEHLGLSSQIVETLMAYDMVQSPVTVDAVAQELTQILAFPDDPVAEGRAYGAVSNIFEDVFQGAYWEAIEGLSPSDRVKLLTMAALGAPPYSYVADWILEELFKLDDEKALPAFVLWSMGVRTKAGSSQDATKCFVFAVMGCAKFLKGPLPFVKPETDDDRAWETYGAILFWMHTPGLPRNEMQARCAPLWERLRTELAFEALDPLFRMEGVTWKSDSGLGGFLQKLCADFPEEFRRILEFGLNNRSKLTSVFGQFHFREDMGAFIVRWLAIVGNRQTLKLLEPLVDSAELGLHALEAVRKLKGTSNIA